MRLTQLTRAGGCAAKLGPRELSEAMQALPSSPIPNVLVGYANADDAGVYRLTPDVNLVQTIDYFTPVVDDPFSYGQIAAANALSDIYAMGGTPRTALSVVCFPAKGVDFAILGEIVRGGQATLDEAGVALLGGHSVRDDEIKFGYAVTGIVATSQIKQNSGARPGDRIFLTKPLGSGLVTTALKNDGARADHVDEAVRVMTQLNRAASLAALRFDAHTMTDVTGFGLIGHLSEVCRASNLSVRIHHQKLPVLPGALEYSQRGFCSGGLENNRDFYSSIADIDQSVSPEFRNLLFDPQTSGGLLIFCDPARAAALQEALEKESILAAEIGYALETRHPSLIEVR